MNVSLPFASPARKQDTTNNNKKGQPHDIWAEINWMYGACCSSQMTHKPVSKAENRR